MPRLNQEQIVFLLWVVLFATFAIALPGFLSYGNIITLIRGVAVLGILAVGMAIVVIGRGIDLSLIAIMAVSTAFAFTLMTAGYPIWVALLLGLVFAAVIGVIVGFLIAYVEIPALFATLGHGSLRLWLRTLRGVSVRIWSICRQAHLACSFLVRDGCWEFLCPSCCLQPLRWRSACSCSTRGSANSSMRPATIP